MVVLLDKIVSKVPIGGFKEIVIAVTKAKSINIVIYIDTDRQNKILLEHKMKKISKSKRKFDVENYDMARQLLCLIKRNYLIQTNMPLKVIEKT